MKLPALGYKTDVRSLGSGVSPYGAVAVGNSRMQAARDVGVATDKVKQAYLGYNAVERKAALLRARLAQEDKMTAVRKQFDGRNEVPLDELRGHLPDGQIEYFERQGYKDVPQYLFKAELLRDKQLQFASESADMLRDFSERDAEQYLTVESIDAKEKYGEAAARANKEQIVSVTAKGLEKAKMLGDEGRVTEQLTVIDSLPQDAQWRENKKREALRTSEKRGIGRLDRLPEDTIAQMQDKIGIMQRYIDQYTNEERGTLLTTDEVTSNIHSWQSTIRRLNRTIASEQVRYTKIAYADARTIATAYQNLQNVTPEWDEKVDVALEGTPDAEYYRREIQMSKVVNDTMKAYRQASPAARAIMSDTANNLVGASNPTNSLTIEKMAQDDKKHIESMMTNWVGYLQPTSEHYITPFDISDPSTYTARAYDYDFYTSRKAMVFPVITNDEAKLSAPELQPSSDPESITKQIAIAGAVQSKFGEDKARKVIRELGQDSGPWSIAAGRLYDGREDAARAIISGGHLIQNDGLSTYIPKIDAWSTEFMLLIADATLVGDIAQTKQAAMQAYAYIVSSKPVDPTVDYDEDALEAAVELAVGRIGNVDGNQTLLPEGVGSDTFEDWHTNTDHAAYIANIAPGGFVNNYDTPETIANGLDSGDYAYVPAYGPSSGVYYIRNTKPGADYFVRHKDSGAPVEYPYDETAPWKHSKKAKALRKKAKREAAFIDNLRTSKLEWPRNGASVADVIVGGISPAYKEKRIQQLKEAEKELGPDRVSIATGVPAPSFKPTPMMPMPDDINDESYDPPLAPVLKSMNEAMKKAGEEFRKTTGGYGF